MTVLANAVAAAPSTADTLEALSGALRPHAHALLRFSYDGRTTAPGYHVTEVKKAALASLDCGANPEAWSETVIQLWDVDGDGSRMTVGKFLAIVGKVQREVGLDSGSALVFEVGDETAAMRLYGGTSVRLAGESVIVELTPRRASCKPRDRWLQSEPAERAACCGPRSSAAVACCR
jgi:hypothetical protein